MSERLQRLKAAVCASLRSDSDLDRRPELWGTWGNLLPPGVTSGRDVYITPQSALTITSAIACINCLSTDLAFLPAKIYQTRANGKGRDEVRDTALWERLSVSPNGETTPMRSRQAMWGHVFGWGNAYWNIEWTLGGEVLGLHIVDPMTKPIRRASDNRLQYKSPDGTVYDHTEIFHLANLGPDGLSGYSPVALVRDAMRLAKLQEGSGLSLYDNGSEPGGFLKTAKRLNPEARQQLREDWESIHRGGHNRHRVGVLADGMEWVQTTLSPIDAQWLEARKFQAIEVSRIYRTPPHKTGDYSQAHLANVEASNIDYVATVIAPNCEQWEQMANLRLLTAKERRDGFYIEHQLLALLRGDMKARSDFYRAMQSIGALNSNEIRSRENLNPIDGGDLYMVPSNMLNLRLAADWLPSSAMTPKRDADNATPN